MNYIVDKNGKELNEKSNHKKRSWISKNMIAALTMIPIAGAMVNFIVKLYIYIYKMGYSSYFQIPNEYLLIMLLLFLRWDIAWCILFKKI